MFVIDGVAYAGQPARDMTVVEVKPLPDLCMLVTFSTGETRLFDATVLLKGPAFAPLLNEDVFFNPVVDGGVCTWNGGAIDVAPEFMYENSFAYEEAAPRLPHLKRWRYRT